MPLPVPMPLGLPAACSRVTRVIRGVTMVNRVIRGFFVIRLFGCGGYLAWTIILYPIIRLTSGCSETWAGATDCSHYFSNRLNQLTHTQGPDVVNLTKGSGVVNCQPTKGIQLDDVGALAFTQQKFTNRKKKTVLVITVYLVITTINRHHKHIQLNIFRPSRSTAKSMTYS